MSFYCALILYIQGIKEEVINFKKKTVSVIRTRATLGGAPDANYEGNGKNTQSYRKVQLFDRSIEILNEEIKLNRKHKHFNPDYQYNG